MYDPTLGRFLQEDPIGIAGGDENFYRYCDNSPLTRVDPTGTIDRKVVSSRMGTNGEFEVRWQFKMEKTYDYTLVLIQKVHFSQRLGVCRVNPTTGQVTGKGNLRSESTATYYEVIGFLAPNETTIGGPSRRGFEDALTAIRSAHTSGTKPYSGAYSPTAPVGLPPVTPPTPPTPSGVSSYDDQWSSEGQDYCSHGQTKMTGEIRAFRLTWELFGLISEWKSGWDLRGHGIAKVSPGTFVGVRADSKSLRAAGWAEKWWDGKEGDVLAEKALPTSLTFRWDCGGEVTMTD